MPVGSQIPTTDGVESAQDQFLLELAADESTQALAHLARGFDRESTADDILREIVVVSEEIGDAGSEGFGFTGAGRGEDLEDRGGGGDGCFLGGVEAFED